MSQNGSIKIHLGQLLKESGLSKNKFCQKAEIQRSQLNGYINNTITCLVGYGSVGANMPDAKLLYCRFIRVHSTRYLVNKNSLKSLQLFQTVFS